MFVTPSQSRLPMGWVLSLTVFAGGFATMALEMCGIRVLTTEYGSSVYTTGSLLTLIMVSLSAGYYLGGRISRTAKSEFPLAVMWLVGALYTFLTNFLFAPSLLEWGFALRMKLVLHPFLMQMWPPSLSVIILYCVPMMLLAATTPFIVQVYVRERGATDSALTAGKTAGGLMALSTFGSILGTSLTSYVLIPELGTRRTLLFFCSSLFVVTGLLFWRSRKHTKLGVVPAMAVWILGIASAAIPPRSEAKPGLIYAGETPYSRIEVWQRTDDDGENYLVYKPNRSYEFSVVYPQHPMKDQLAMSFITPAAAWGAKKVLVLGTAAGGSILQLLQLGPDMDLTGVDLDPAIVDMSQTMFGVPRLPNVHQVALDARVFLRQTEEKYDYIIVDLYAGDQLPTHCATEEFYRLVRSHLGPNGIAVVNSNMQDYPWSNEGRVFRPLRHLHASLFAAGFKTVFQNDMFNQGHLYAFSFEEPIADFRERLAVLARDPKLPIELRVESLADAFKSVPVVRPGADTKPFTDDWSPDDLMSMKGNVVALTKELADAPESTESDLRAVVGREMVQFLGEYGFWGLSQVSYCPKLAAWASRQNESPGAMLDALSRFHPAFINCGESAGSAGLSGSDERFKLATAYSVGLQSVVENHAAAALPILLRIADEADLGRQPTKTL